MAKKISYKLFDKQKQNGPWRCGVTRAHLNFLSRIHLILLDCIAIYCQYFIFLRNDGYCKIVDVYIISSIKSVIGHVVRPPSINKRIGVLNDLVHWSFYPKTTIMLSNVAFSVVLTTKITKINSKHNKKTIYTKKQTYFFQLWVSKSNICSSKLNQYMEFFLNQQFYNFCFL